MDFILGGHNIKLEKDDVLKIFRTLDLKKSPEIRNWYVEIESNQIPPKWLMSKVTNIPTDEFISHQAVVIFRKLGFEVKAREYHPMHDKLKVKKIN